MKTIKVFASLAVIVTAFFALSSFVTHDDSMELRTEMTVEAHSHAHGKRCNGTVGCSCSGFSAITNGKVWQTAYCKRCGHHRSCHR